MKDSPKKWLRILLIFFILLIILVGVLTLLKKINIKINRTPPLPLNTQSPVYPQYTRYPMEKTYIYKGLNPDNSLKVYDPFEGNLNLYVPNNVAFFCRASKVISNGVETDASNFILDFSAASEEVKNQIFNNAINMPVSQKFNLLREYPLESPLTIGYIDEGHLDTINRLTIFISDIKRCSYE